jgi:hypothetical protein
MFTSMLKNSESPGYSIVAVIGERVLFWTASSYQMTSSASWTQQRSALSVAATGADEGGGLGLGFSAVAGSASSLGPLVACEI